MQVFPDASHVDFTLGLSDDLIVHVLAELDKDAGADAAEGGWGARRSPQPQKAAAESEAAAGSEDEPPLPPLAALSAADARDLASVVEEARRRARRRAAAPPRGGQPLAAAACAAEFPWLGAWTHRWRVYEGLDAEAAEGFV